MRIRRRWLALHPKGDYVSDLIRRTGDFYEADILDALRDRISGGVLVDAGAMIGNHTVYFASFLSHSAIHAFEPWPESLHLLRRNVKPYPNVTVHPEALSDRPGPLWMVSETNRGHNRVSDEGTQPVWGMPLDSFGLSDVSLLKIDVEGHEPQVLAGAADTIARCHPLLMLEDWEQTLGPLLPDYRLVHAWPTHQTYLYEWAA